MMFIFISFNCLEFLRNKLIYILTIHISTSIHQLSKQQLQDKNSYNYKQTTEEINKSVSMSSN